MLHNRRVLFDDRHRLDIIRASRLQARNLFLPRHSNPLIHAFWADVTLADPAAAAGLGRILARQNMHHPLTVAALEGVDLGLDMNISRGPVDRGDTALAEIPDDCGEAVRSTQAFIP